MAVTVIKHVDKALLSLGRPETAEDIDIVITDDLISAVGRGAGSRTAADKVIDASGALVHPGLVCSHHHFYSGLSRGIMAEIGPTPDFISTLRQLWWRIDRALDERSVYLSSLICCLDAVRCGTTAVIDHHSSPSFIEGSLDAVRRGFETAGLRGMTCYEVTGRNRGEDEIEQGIAETMQAGAVPMQEIDLSAIKNMRLETFKMPVEDVITIRKSLDRLSKIQNKVLSLISVNLSELSMAIEEEEKALTRTQVKHLRMVEGDAKQPGEVENSGSFKIAFPQEYDEDEILRYFEVLSDEYGLHLSEIRCVGRPKEVNNGSFKIPLDVRLEGRYRGLLELLDHLRKEEDAITVKKVRTSRSEQVPARISISINVDSFYQNEPPSGEK